MPGQARSEEYSVASSQVEFFSIQFAAIFRRAGPAQEKLIAETRHPQKALENSSHHNRTAMVARHKEGHAPRCSCSNERARSREDLLVNPHEPLVVCVGVEPSERGLPASVSHLHGRGPVAGQPRQSAAEILRVSGLDEKSILLM